MCQCGNVANAQPHCPVRFFDTAVASATTAAAASSAGIARLLDFRIKIDIIFVEFVGGML